MSLPKIELAPTTDFTPDAVLTEDRARKILEAVRGGAPKVKIFVYESGGGAAPRISEVTVDLSDDESGLGFFRGSGWGDLGPGPHSLFDALAGTTLPLPLPQEDGEAQPDRLATPGTLRALYVALLKRRLEEEQTANRKREDELRGRIFEAGGEV